MQLFICRYQKPYGVYKSSKSQLFLFTDFITTQEWPLHNLSEKIGDYLFKIQKEAAPLDVKRRTQADYFAFLVKNPQCILFIHDFNFSNHLLTRFSKLEQGYFRYAARVNPALVKLEQAISKNYLRKLLAPLGVKLC